MAIRAPDGANNEIYGITDIYTIYAVHSAAMSQWTAKTHCSNKKKEREDDGGKGRQKILIRIRKLTIDGEEKTLLYMIELMIHQNKQ